MSPPPPPPPKSQETKIKLTVKQREELKAERERIKVELKAKKEEERLKKEQEKLLREQERRFVIPRKLGKRLNVLFSERSSSRKSKS